ncbi:MAG: class II aldolase/adducin family protein [Candidatus Omnitrophica bacterium]|nr:class II aldolase/adducin family protein [Candidatus Omnitrophota bacterium]
MIFGRDKEIKSQIINTGKKLADLRLVAATSGNLSARVNEDTILITATGTSLGNLKEDDIIKVDITKEETGGRLSTEFPLHRLVYKNFSAKTVIHCHPPLVNGYFAVYSELKALTFESRIYLGNVPVVPQETPSVTKPQLVIEALRTLSPTSLKKDLIWLMRWKRR